MEPAVLVIILAGLAVPITLLLVAIGFEVAVLVWASLYVWHRRSTHWIGRLTGRMSDAAQSVLRGRHLIPRLH